MDDKKLEGDGGMLNAFVCLKCGSKEKTINTREEGSDLHEFKKHGVESGCICVGCGSLFMTECNYENYDNIFSFGC